MTASMASRGYRALGLLVLACVSCASTQLPDPQEAARQWAAAVEGQDSAALHALLSRSGQRRFTEAEVDERMSRLRPELRQLARAAASPDARVHIQAQVPLSAAPPVTLSYNPQAGFRLLDTAFVPLPSNHPRETLEQLRWVLERRSYFGLLRLMTKESREVLQKELGALVQALSQSEVLPMEGSGDFLTVPLPSGHEVKLKREGGNWRVHELR